MRHVIVFLVVSCFPALFLIAELYEATTYYVAPSGDDSNHGTLTKLYKTIHNGIDIVEPRDTFNMFDYTIK